MGKRNVYKDIVCFAVFCALMAAVAGQINIYFKEQKSYGFFIQSNGDLTVDVAAEFPKLTGICRFEPEDTTKVTIRLGTYTLETELTGLELKEYPLRWKAVQHEITMGNTPALFLGAETFLSFTDKNGYVPGKSQVEKWIKQYQKLQVTITDESGRERNAKICGILMQPGNQVCMDKKQMNEIFCDFVHTKGGYMEIHGYRNMVKVRKLLEDADFATKECD